MQCGRCVTQEKTAHMRERPSNAGGRHGSPKFDGDIQQSPLARTGPPLVQLITGYNGVQLSRLQEFGELQRKSCTHRNAVSKNVTFLGVVGKPSRDGLDITLKKSGCPKEA